VTARVVIVVVVISKQSWQKGFGQQSQFDSLLELRSNILCHSLDELPFLLQWFLQTRRTGSLREVGGS
jgi:hypothetical protein